MPEIDILLEAFKKTHPKKKPLKVEEGEEGSKVKE